MKRVLASMILMSVALLNVNSQSITIQSLSGTIEVITHKGGQLLLDGKVLGEVPASSKVTIKDAPIGQHIVTLRKTDGKEFVQSIFVSSGKTSLIQFFEAGSIPFKIGLVTDLGGIADGSFNQATWKGIVRFGNENGLVMGTDYKYLQSDREYEFAPNLRVFADEQLDLIVAPGFLFEKSLEEVAHIYPEQHFLAIDTVVTKPNVVSAVFSEHEGSFLVGVAAGLKAKADGYKVLGFIGGMQFPLIERYQAGFEQGVKAVYPAAKVLVDYAGDFANPELGKRIARKQYDAGAYIIYHAAGGTGNGMIYEARDRSARGDICWAIGVDSDQYDDSVYGDKSAVLTSMLKRVDVAVYEVAKLALAGNFPGGTTLVFSVQNNGMSIPEENPNLSPNIVAAVTLYAAKIAAGEIKVGEVPGK